ncbi:MAG: hypothetical protein COY39_04830 [Alphaproteobacteria bacterium CG_4_10_14_0_8_um_filter_37_21]|nr:MAG: hypothetical protein COY39_04830 [Alphaproteobacteria bacterium CG_4_10_14_0_8_um_filter_37_21]
MKNLHLTTLASIGCCFVPINLSASTMEMRGTVTFDGHGHYILSNIESFTPSSEVEDPLDYRGCRISDIKYNSSISLESILDKVKQTISSFPQGTARPTLILSENYLTEVGFSKLVDFFISSENDLISKSISCIDLSNNRIRATAESDILRLLEKFPHITLDLSINYLSFSELTKITPEMKERILIR